MTSEQSAPAATDESPQQEEEVTIPTVDLSDLASPDRGVREGAAAIILGAFGTYGLIYVKNHGVDFALRDRLFDRFYAFTERSAEEKEPLNRPEIWFQRGWTPPNIETAVASSGQPDFKECYFAAPIGGLDNRTAAPSGYPEVYCRQRLAGRPAEAFKQDLPGARPGDSRHRGCSLLRGLCPRPRDACRRTRSTDVPGAAGPT